MQGTPETRIATIISDARARKMEIAFKVERAGIDETARTVPLSFASENPVERWFGMEVLDVSAASCDLSRLLNQGAVLVNHDWDDQVGVCIEATIDATTKKARMVAKFSRSERGEEIFQDIKDGIRGLVSVGYIVRKMVLQSAEGEVETYRVTDWQPYEVSVVSVPADTSVGVGRSLPKEKDKPALVVEQRQKKPITMSEPAAAATAAPVITAVVDHSAERNRVKELNAAARALITRHPAHAEAFRDLAAKCAETGDGVDVFNRTVLNDILATQRTLAPVTQDPNAARAGMDGKDVRRYSTLRAISLIAEGKPLDGLERECDVELTRKLGRQPKGFFLPDEIIQRDRSQRTQTVGVPADGGFTVPIQQLDSEFVALLRNAAKVVGLGARYISGLQGDVTIPRQLTGATAYWVSETGSITQSGATFGQITAKPRRIGTSVPYSKQWLAQSSLSAESFVTNDSDESIAVELDRVAINGKGGAEPLGILNLASGDRSTSVTFGGAATWAKYVEFWTNVATNNAILGTPAYLTTPASAAKAMTIAKFSNTGFPIWDNDKVGVFRADWSNQFPSSPTANQVIFGDFSQVIFFEWAGRDVVVDPYSGKKEGTVEVTIQRLIDMTIRRGKSFAISADTGAA